MKLTGKNGVLRISDSAAVIHGAAPLDNLTLDMVKFDGVSTWTNITTDLEADDANIATAFLTDINDKVYVGSDGRFAMIKFLKGGGTNFAAGSGALIARYYNGTDFTTVLVGSSDGTASGGDCFAQDGYITFIIPDDWVRGANSHNVNLDSDKYYIELGTTTHASTDPDADILAPVDGQYYEIAFSQMDFSGPMGRPKCEEALVLDRNTMSSKAHYIEGMDGKKYDPLEISFSCILDDVYNKDDLFVAMECGDPDSARWTATGTTSKGTTKNDGSNYNPAFKESAKKTVNVMILFDETRAVAKTQVKPQGWAYYEVFFPMDESTITEGEDGTILNCRGGVYGIIERVAGMANRY